MLSWLSAYYKPVLHWSGREDTTLLEHGRIVDLLEEKNVPGAVKLMGDHLNRSAPPLRLQIGRLATRIFVRHDHARDLTPLSSGYGSVEGDGLFGERQAWSRAYDGVRGSKSHKTAQERKAFLREHNLEHLDEPQGQLPCVQAGPRSGVNDCEPRQRKLKKAGV